MSKQTHTYTDSEGKIVGEVIFKGNWEFCKKHGKAYLKGLQVLGLEEIEKDIKEMEAVK